MSAISAELSRRVGAGSGEQPYKCYQCKRCSVGCPVAPFADLHPAQIMRAVQLGDYDAAVRSRMVWLCTGCETCTTRCPQGIDVAGKTGTAEIPAPYGYEPFAAGNSIASFLAFLPADDPVVSILIKLDRPWGYWGSMTAAPLAEELLERLVVLMEIPPDDLRYQLIAQGGSPFAREY